MSNLVGILFLIYGSAFLLYIAVLKHRVRKAMSWPSVSGEVTGTDISEECSAPGGRSCFKPVIRYRYTVKGRSYESERYFFGRQASASISARAEKHVSRYPVGSEVTVYYNPRDPASACLERGVEKTGFVMKFGFVLIIIGLIFLIGIFKV
jgi:hypothetical protein